MTVNYSFRCQTRNEDGSIGILLRYLLDDDLHPSATHRDMVLQTLRSFWTPFAYQAFGYDAIECQKYARSAANQLQQHILYLHSYFGLEAELSTRVATSSLTSAAIPVAVQASVPESAEAAEINLPPPLALVLPDLEDDPFT
ncbi:MAG TPA: hypothetical protein VL134_04585 [Leptolyngbya sp.]|nr:hypothetical protein [Leptolyngbya sp.]